MANKTVSLVVPIFNMSDYLPALWDSLSSSGTMDQLSEIIFINDGSTDSTMAVIDGLKRESPKVRVVDLEANQGRFIARYRGAEAAKGSHILFIDARTALNERFGNSLGRLLENHDALMGMLFIDVSKSVFNLYWQRTHETLFRKHFEDAKKGFYLNSENYESYAKGTTIFLCTRAAFLSACHKYRDRPLHSDDTFLMREIVKDTPIWVEESLAIDWEPRQGYWPFLQRLWERGPQFAEYHVFERQGLYFFLFLIWTLTVGANLFFLVMDPLTAVLVLVAEITLLALSTAVFARSPSEFFRMIPVHVGTILAYGLGAIYGVGVNLKLFKRPDPTGAKSG